VNTWLCDTRQRKTSNDDDETSGVPDDLMENQDDMNDVERIDVVDYNFQNPFGELELEISTGEQFQTPKFVAGNYIITKGAI
jgi:hypothetical protein